MAAGSPAADLESRTSLPASGTGNDGLRGRLVPWILAAVVVGATVSWIRRPGDFAGYVSVGQLALAGRHIYRDAPPGVNTWPPFFSLLCVPLALLARPTPFLARGVWLVLNYVLLWLTVKMLAGLVYGRALRLRPGGPGLSIGSPEILLPLLLCYRFILGNFDHLQVNIVIFAAVVAGLSCQARGQDGRAGIAIGLAAALKVMPVIFVPYFVYRRRFGVALWAAAATLAFSLSPALVYGWARFIEFARAWRQAVGVGWGVGEMNQSVYAMFDRFVGHGITPLHAAPVAYLPASGSAVASGLTAAVLLAVTGTAMWLFRGRQAPDSAASLLEYGVVFIVSALFGPLAWKAYLVVLLCPCMVLVGVLRRHLRGGDRAVVLAVLSAYFVLAVLPAPGLLGRRLAGALEMLSAPTLGTLLLLGVLLWARARCAGVTGRAG